MTAIFPYYCIYSKHGALIYRTGFSNDFGRYRVDWRFTGSPHVRHAGYFLCYGYPPLSFPMYGLVA
jgi:hypothetical protein